jgi:hypothetical protein
MPGKAISFLVSPGGHPLRLFETDTLPGMDQRPFVRQLLAELRDPSKASAPELAKVSAEVSAEHICYVRQVLAFAQIMTA